MEVVTWVVQAMAIVDTRLRAGATTCMYTYLVVVLVLVLVLLLV